MDGYMIPKQKLYFANRAEKHLDILLWFYFATFKLREGKNTYKRVNKSYSMS